MSRAAQASKGGLHSHRHSLGESVEPAFVVDGTVCVGAGFSFPGSINWVANPTSALPRSRSGAPAAGFFLPCLQVEAALGARPVAAALANKRYHNSLDEALIVACAMARWWLERVRKPWARRQFSSKHVGSGWKRE